MDCGQEIEDVSTKDLSIESESGFLGSDSRSSGITNQPLSELLMEENCNPLKLDIKRLESGDLDSESEMSDLFDEPLVGDMKENCSNMDQDTLELRSQASDFSNDSRNNTPPELAEDMLLASASFLETFMSSKKNVEALIDALYHHPGLWNYDLATKHRKKEKRMVYWEQMALEINKSLSLQITNDQVGVLILYLHKKIREIKESGPQDLSDEQLALPSWVYKRLKFLHGFVTSLPLAHLDIHQELAPRQIEKVLYIFKRCSHLWDTNSVEYYCKNKRIEAISKMKQLIGDELHIEVDENILKNYIGEVTDFFAKQKRIHLRPNKARPEETKYYKKLKFLMDHIGPFKCSICSCTLLSPLKLKVHISMHDGTMPLKCSLCDKEYKRVEPYVHHIRRHMDDLNAKCKECGRKFLRLADMESHMRSHTGAKPFVCEVCGSSFRHRTGLNQHMQRHRKKFSVFCPHCSKGFYNNATLEQHVRTHKEERDFKCTKCEKAFKTKKILKIHKTTHENGHHECNLCGKAFKSRINLRQHKRNHGSNTSKAGPKLI